jgi:hypothetical protein
MLFKVYSKWIDGSDNHRERAKLDPAFVHDLCTARRDDPTTARYSESILAEREGFEPATPRGYTMSVRR